MNNHKCISPRANYQKCRDPECDLYESSCVKPEAAPLELMVHIIAKAAATAGEYGSTTFLPKFEGRTEEQFRKINVHLYCDIGTNEDLTGVLLGTVCALNHLRNALNRYLDSNIKLDELTEALKKHPDFHSILDFTPYRGGMFCTAEANHIVAFNNIYSGELEAPDTDCNFKPTDISDGLKNQTAKAMENNNG